MSENEYAVTVTILDREYTVACGEDEQEDLMEAARLLNSRLRTIQRRGRVMGTERCAVMAALNLAHELLVGQRPQTLDDDTEERLRVLTEKVEIALDDARQISI